MVIAWLKHGKERLGFGRMGGSGVLILLVRNFFWQILFLYIVDKV